MAEEHGDSRRPPGWVPGIALDPDRYAGYTLAEATAAVGAGWAALVHRAHEAISHAGGRVVQVKEKWGSLAIYHRADDGRWAHDPSEPYSEVEAIVRQCEEESIETCEQCGRRGRLVIVEGMTAARCTACHPQHVVVLTPEDLALRAARVREVMERRPRDDR